MEADHLFEKVLPLGLITPERTPLPERHRHDREAQLPQLLPLEQRAPARRPAVPEEMRGPVHLHCPLSVAGGRPMPHQDVDAVPRPAAKI